MEQARIFIAILLSFVVFFVWDVFFGNREAIRPPVEAPARQEQAVIDSKAPASQEPENIEARQAVAPSDAILDQGPVETVTNERSARKIRVENAKYRIVIDEIGGAIRSVALK